MSWLDKITNQTLTIITGDGQEFTPIWRRASKSRETNPTRFEFNDTLGTLVKRSLPSSPIYPFELFFQGENNIEESTRFEQATFDLRPWTIKHPYYDDILCHPSAISIDSSNQNVSIVTGEFWETIADTYPDSTIDVKDEVLKSVDLNTAIVAQNYAAKLGTPESTAIATINATLDAIGNELRAAAVTDLDLENVENALAVTKSSVNNLSSDANTFMTNAANLARTPARFYSNVKTRINTIESSYQNLKLAVTGLLTRQNKLYFESMGSAFNSAKAEASVLTASDIADEQDIEDNQISDYKTRKNVTNIVDDLSNSVDDMLTTLGDFQSENDSTPDSYTPSPDVVV